MVEEFKNHLLKEEQSKKIIKETPEEFYSRVGRLVNSTEIIKNNFILRPTGLLKNLGYRVGSRGLPESERRKILEQAFFMSKLPSEFDDESSPGSPERFKRVVQSIKWLIDSKTGIKNDNYQKSLDEWKDDMAWFESNFG